jgi:transposase
VSVLVTMQSDQDRVVIAVDPHKASWTAAAVDASLQPLATVRVSVSRDGYRALRRFARRWPNAGWAIEGAGGLGAPLTTRLRADEIEVIDVPAKLAARVRVLSTGHGRKSDDADALSIGIAALTSRTLNTAEIDTATTALRAIVEHRDDLVKTRTQTVNRLHVVLTNLVPAGAGRNLTADHAAELLRGVRPHDAAGKTLRALAMDLVSEVRQLDRRIAKAARDIEIAVTASGTTLTELHGIGALTAGKILGRAHGRTSKSTTCGPPSHGVARTPTPKRHYGWFPRCSCSG